MANSGDTLRADLHSSLLGRSSGDGLARSAAQRARPIRRSGGSGARRARRTSRPGAPTAGARGPMAEVSIGTKPRARAGEVGARAKVGSSEVNCGSASAEPPSLPARCHPAQPSPGAEAEVALKSGADAGCPTAKYVLLEKEKFAKPPAHVVPTMADVEPLGSTTTLRSKVKDEHLPWSQPGWQQQLSCGDTAGSHVEGSRACVEARTAASQRPDMSTSGRPGVGTSPMSTS